MPRIAAMAVASAPAAAPRSSERRAPTTTCEKMSLPWSVVPNRWCHEGAWRASSRLNSVRVATEISGAISATTTMKPTHHSPMRDFGLRSSSVSQPGSGDARAARDRRRQAGARARWARAATSAPPAPAGRGRG